MQLRWFLFFAVPWRNQRRSCGEISAIPSSTSKLLQLDNHFMQLSLDLYFCVLLLCLFLRHGRILWLYPDPIFSKHLPSSCSECIMPRLVSGPNPDWHAMHMFFWMIRRFLQRPCELLASNRTMLQMTSANSEIGIGFQLIFMIIT